MAGSEVDCQSPCPSASPGEHGTAALSSERFGDGSIFYAYGLADTRERLLRASGIFSAFRAGTQYPLHEAPHAKFAASLVRSGEFDVNERHPEGSTAFSY